MNWDKIMTANAAADGWRLADTIDNGSSHVYLMVARAPTSSFKTDRLAAGFVLARARERSPLHVHALQLVAASRIKPTKGKK